MPHEANNIYVIHTNVHGNPGLQCPKDRPTVEAIEQVASGANNWDFQMRPTPNALKTAVKKEVSMSIRPKPCDGQEICPSSTSEKHSSPKKFQVTYVHKKNCVSMLAWSWNVDGQRSSSEDWRGYTRLLVL